jgi:hypothetical protein
MVEAGVAGKRFYLGDDSQNGYLYGLVNIAAFLGQVSDLNGHTSVECVAVISLHCCCIFLIHMSLLFICPRV